MMIHVSSKKRKEKKKLRKQQNKPLTSIKEKGPLGLKTPSPEKENGGQ